MTADTSEYLDVTFVDPENEDETFTTDEAAEPNPDFVEEKKETPRAKKYRLKTKHGLNFLMRSAAGNPATIADAAAIVHYGPGLSAAVGNLCDKDERARKFVDFVTDETLDSPWAAVAVTAIPLAIQMLRNHEGAEVKVKTGWRIPFTKRTFNLKLPAFKIKVERLRPLTYEPSYLADHVFGNPAIREALDAQGVNVAWPIGGYSTNGRHAA